MNRRIPLLGCILFLSIFLTACSHKSTDSNPSPSTSVEAQTPSAQPLDPVKDVNKIAPQVIRDFCEKMEAGKTEEVKQYLSDKWKKTFYSPDVPAVVFRSFKVLKLKQEAPPNQEDSVFPYGDTLATQYYVELDVKAEGVTAWNDGVNDRFFVFVLEDGTWKIDAIATSP